MASRSSIRNISPGAIAEIDNSSTRQSSVGVEIASSWVCERRFSTSSPLFLLNFALSRSRMVIALAAATENGLMAPHWSEGSGQQELPMGWGKNSEAEKNLGREGNDRGFSKSGLASHSETSRISLRCPHKKSEKTPGESPWMSPGRFCGSPSPNTKLTSSLRILLFRVLASNSRGFS